jgi:hypothetical protein
MKAALIKRQIAACESFIRNFESGLPYADGAAYGQDKQRIRDLKNEAKTWREILELVTKEQV